MLYCPLLHEIIYSIAIMGVRIIFAKQSGLNHGACLQLYGNKVKTVIETKYSWILLRLTVQPFLRILCKQKHGMKQWPYLQLQYPPQHKYAFYHPQPFVRYIIFNELKQDIIYFYVQQFLASRCIKAEKPRNSLKSVLHLRSCF